MDDGILRVCWCLCETPCGVSTFLFSCRGYNCRWLQLFNFYISSASKLKTNIQKPLKTPLKSNASIHHLSFKQSSSDFAKESLRFIVACTKQYSATSNESFLLCSIQWFRMISNLISFQLIVWCNAVWEEGGKSSEKAFRERVQDSKAHVELQNWISCVTQSALWR
jgi:hypothetical protein